MSHIGHEDDVPTAVETVDRKELLTEQFNEVEAQDQHAPQESGRPRDDSGRFAPKEKAAVPATAAPVKQAAQSLQPAPPVEPAEPQPWANAPKSWKKELAANWQQLDPRYQQYVHEREDQMRQGVEPLLPKAELADSIMQVAEPYMNTIRGLGVDLPTAVGALMQADHLLRTLPYEHKIHYLANLAASYGVDLTGQLAQAQAGVPPQVQQLQNELLGIKGQIQTYQQQQEATQHQAALTEISRFAKSADHFEEARPVMIQLLQSGMAEGIEDAYHKAIRLNPDLYDEIVAAKHASADADRRKTADEAAKRAKAAAVSVRSATPGTRTATNAQDRRSMLREQLDALSERL